MTTTEQTLVDKCLTKRNFYIAISVLIVLISSVWIASTFVQSKTMSRIVNWMLLDFPVGALIGLFFLGYIESTKKTEHKFLRALGFIFFAGAAVEGIIIPEVHGIVANTFDNDIDYEILMVWEPYWHNATPQEDAVHGIITKVWTSIGIVTMTVGCGALVVSIQKLITKEID